MPIAILFEFQIFQTLKTRFRKSYRVSPRQANHLGLLYNGCLLLNILMQKKHTFLRNFHIFAISQR